MLPYLLVDSRHCTDTLSGHHEALSHRACNHTSQTGQSGTLYHCSSCRSMDRRLEKKHKTINLNNFFHKQYFINAIRQNQKRLL